MKLITLLLKLKGFTMMMGVGKNRYIFIKAKKHGEFSIAMSGESLYEDGKEIEIK